MLIAFKALGATCLAGALAASGLFTTDHFAGHAPTDGSAGATLVTDPHATFQALAVGQETQVSADEAGSVTVKRTAAGLEVAAVAPAANWTAATKTLAPDWLLITFETTTTEPPTTTTTEAPTTTTTAPPPKIVTLPPPVQPTVIPVAGAGTVVIVLQGPIVVIRDVKAVPGWVASIERRSGDVDVLFRRGDRSFRFVASMADQHLTSAIREVRADGDHPVGFDDHRGDPTDDHHDGGHRGKG
jgi:hypothetical protein